MKTASIVLNNYFQDIDYRNLLLFYMIQFSLLRVDKILMGTDYRIINHSNRHYPYSLVTMLINEHHTVTVSYNIEVPESVTIGIICNGNIYDFYLTKEERYIKLVMVKPYQQLTKTIPYQQK